MNEPLPAHHLIIGDSLHEIPALPDDHFQAIIADPPYFQVLLDQACDNQWASADAYLDWLADWLRLCRPKLRAPEHLQSFSIASTTTPPPLWQYID